MRQLRIAVSDAIDEGESEALRDEIVRILPDSDVTEIEHRADTGDIYEFISEVLDEWSMDDLDELLELLEAHLADADIDFRYETGLDPDSDE